MQARRRQRASGSVSGKGEAAGGSREPARLDDPRAGEAERWRAAFEAGAATDPAAVDRLVRALGGDPAARVREESALSLGKLKARAAVDPLVRALSEESSPHVREAAAWSLGELAAPEAIGALADALRDQERSVRRQAAEALSMLGAAGTHALTEAAARPRRRGAAEAKRALARIRPVRPA